MKYPVLKDTLIAAGVTALANALLVVIAMTVFKVSMAVTMAGETTTVGVPHMMFASILNCLVAGLVFAGVKKWTRNPLKVFYIISLIVFIATFYNVKAAEMDTPTTVVLVLSHIIAAVLIVGGVTMSYRKNKPVAPASTPVQPV